MENLKLRQDNCCWETSGDRPEITKKQELHEMEVGEAAALAGGMKDVN
jgi:hypothetical protein